MSKTTQEQFDAIALEYNFMAELFHKPDLYLAHMPVNRVCALDMGCGSGLLVSALSSHFEQVIGIDISANLLRIAQKKYSTRQTLFCQMDIEQPGFVRQFDYIVSHNAFHHLEDVAQTLATMKTLLKPGGRLMLRDVTSPFETSPRIISVAFAIKRYLPDLRRFGRKAANRIFRFHLSKHWLDHLASDRFLSKRSFEELYREQLPGCRFLAAGCLVWDQAS